MTFGYRGSRSRGGGFRSSRGSRGSFRGRGGRGSDSYFGSSSRAPYTEKSSYRGNSYRGSSFRDRDDYYESRSSGSKYGHDKYSSSHSRKDDDYHHRESGSFGRDHSRRSDGEPERKKLRSEIGSYKEGVSPRRSGDDFEHSSRSFKGYSSPYHSDSSPFGKSHKKEYSDFKKPIPLMDQQFGGRRSRGSRGRGMPRAARALKSSAPASLKRSGVSRISRLSTAARLQQLLRRKKQLRMMRMRREREQRLRVSGAKHEDDENNIASSDGELGLDDLENDDQPMEEEDEDVKPDVKTLNEETSEGKKVAKKVTKKEPGASPEKSGAAAESEEPKEKKKSNVVKGLRRDHITLKCVHCQKEYDTFRIYQVHLKSFKHQLAMENLMNTLRMRLSRMRMEQREQQRIIDEQSDDFAKTSYCKLCKLNYKQTKQEHNTSDFHININEFLNPRCGVCRMSFPTPIMYEQHRATLQHIRQKAFLEREKSSNLKDMDVDDENNDEDKFMVLDSVGSADEESNEETGKSGEAGDAEASASTESKKKAPKLLGSEFIKKVSCYYCKLCRLCLTYNPNRDQEELLLSHCRGRFHLKRFSLEKLKTKKKEENKEKSENQTENANASTNEAGEGETDEKFWADEEAAADGHKTSEDEEDSQPGNRFDRFGNSDEKETVEKLKTNAEVGAEDAEADEPSNAEDVAVKEEPE